MTDYASRLKAGSPPPTETAARTDYAARLRGDVPADPQPSPEPPGLLARASAFVTGRGRREDGIGEITGLSGLPLKQALTLAGGLLAAQDEEAARDVVAAALPEATFEADKFGNPVVRHQGQRYYLNTPGLSMLDANQFAALTAAFTPAGRVGGALASVPARAAAVGGASAATSVGIDTAAQALGSEQPASVGRAALAGVAGAAGEAVSPLIAQAWAKTPWARRLTGPDGRLNPDGVREVRRAGADPGDLPPEVITEFDRLSRRLGRAFTSEAEAATALRAARANALGVRMTRGQRTGDVRQLAREEAMRNFARGEGAGKTLQRFDAAQQADVTAAAQRMQGRLSGRDKPSVGDADEAGAVVLGGVSDAAETLSREIDRAYDTARGYSARLAASDAETVGDGARRVLRDGDRVIDPLLTPSTLKALKELDGIVPTVPGGTVSKVSLKYLERVRRRMRVYAQAAANPADRANVAIIQRRFDGWLDDAFDQALFSGDADALDALKQARSLRRTYAARFEDESDAGKLVQKMLQDGTTNLEAANWLFGFSRLGESGRSVRLARGLKDILPPEAWGAVREGAFHRLIYGPKATTEISYQQAYTRLSEALDGRGREFMRELFKPEEMRQFQLLRSTLKDLVAPPEARNPSRSGYEAARAVNDAMGKLAGMVGMLSGPVTGAVMLGAGKGRAAVTNRAAARQALRDPLPAPRIGPLLPAGTAALGVQTSE